MEFIFIRRSTIEIYELPISKIRFIMNKFRNSFFSVPGSPTMQTGKLWAPAFTDELYIDINANLKSVNHRNLTIDQF